MDKIGKWMDEDEYLFTKSMHAFIESRIIWDLKRIPKSVFRVKKKRPEYRHNVSVVCYILNLFATNVTRLYQYSNT